MCLAICDSLYFEDVEHKSGDWDKTKAKPDGSEDMVYFP